MHAFTRVEFRDSRKLAKAIATDKPRTVTTFVISTG